MHVAIHVLAIVITSANAVRVSGDNELNKTFCMHTKALVMAFLSVYKKSFCFFLETFILQNRKGERL